MNFLNFPPPPNEWGAECFVLLGKVSFPYIEGPTVFEFEWISNVGTKFSIDFQFLNNIFNGFPILEQNFQWISH